MIPYGMVDKPSGVYWVLARSNKGNDEWVLDPQSGDARTYTRDAEKAHRFYNQNMAAMHSRDGETIYKRTTV